ncbi:MAG: PatB family C-S lyase [Candidatus Cloacimonetes bacterium]|jgi:cystathionine beta-lyase|nr:PatB family C-S lyase [Candidatus Cloacimonadota bacterium]MDY0172098.1 PatB family C-S lyase [Candidatus Cloacimonadaceae bacterium]
MNFDTIIDRRGSGCFKYDGLKLRYGRDDLIPLWVADMDFAVAEPIQAALAQRLKHPIFGYNFIGDDFYDAVRHWQKTQYGWDTSTSEIIMIPSLMTALAYTILALSEPGDKIVIQTPVYPPFHSTVKEQHRELLTSALVNIDGHYEINWPDFEEKIKQAKLFILCNPHNPVGRVFTREELERMSDICARYNVIIFSDEIHADLVYAPHKHIPIASIKAERVISAISPAKSFNVAGLATGVLILKDKEFIQKISEMNMSLHTFMGNAFGIRALIAAYTQSAPWLASVKEYLTANRDYLVAFLAEHLPKVKMSPCEGSYLAWLDFREYQLSDDELMQILCDKAGVALNPGPSFGSEGSGFMRLNFACPRAVLHEALVRIKKNFQEV